MLNDSFDHDGYRIRIRLPGESNVNLQCSFGMDVTIKVRKCSYVAVFVFTDLMLQNLYQYAFAFSNIQGRFLIYTMSPRAAVPCSELILANGRFEHVFAVEKDKSGIDPAVLFVASYIIEQYN